MRFAFPQKWGLALLFWKARSHSQQQLTSELPPEKCGGLGFLDSDQSLKFQLWTWTCTSLRRGARTPPPALGSWGNISSLPHVLFFWFVCLLFSGPGVLRITGLRFIILSTSLQKGLWGMSPPFHSSQQGRGNWSKAWSPCSENPSQGRPFLKCWILSISRWPLSTCSVESFSCPLKVRFVRLPETWPRLWGNIFKCNP